MSAARPLRLFVALELPGPAREALLELQGRADPAVWRPVAPDALHLTLAFLGPRPPGSVDAIAAVVGAEEGAAAPELALAGALLLPPRRPRVLCAAVADPSGALADLQRRVSRALEAAGAYAPERRPFRPHATVARLRPRAAAPREAPADPRPVAFRAAAVTLYASRLHPSGARYEPLRRSALRGGPE